MGRAQDAWDRLAAALTSGDVTDLLELYGADAVYLESYNPPHRGNLLIQAYVKDWLTGKESVAVDVVRAIEGVDGSAIGVEWTIGYTAAGRRWADLPRATFLALDDAGRVVHHRDYT